MVFELIPYTDQLLQKVGLSSQRKFSPCVATNLGGLKDEYMRRYGDDFLKPAEARPTS